MKIGFDGKRAANNLTGLGNYSRSLIEHLANGFPQNQYFIYTPKAKLEILNFPLFKRENIFLKLPQKAKLLWRGFGVKHQLLKDRIDLFHGLSYEIPFGLKKTGIKSIVTIHDLIFLRKPQYYQPIDRLIYDYKSKYACKNANQIIAISEKTKQDIIELYNISPAKIEVIYQSCDDSFKVDASAVQKAEVKTKYALPEQYLLSVGTIEPRKNILAIVKAMPKIDTNFKLILIGKEKPYANKVKQEIERLGLADRVIFLKNIPFKDLPSIYQMASLFVLPSYYEGFGIPIIEALYSRVPVVAATGSCLEEAGGPNSLYVNPDDFEGFSTVINNVLVNNALQQAMKQQGLQYVQKFNNEVINDHLMACYSKTLNI